MNAPHLALVGAGGVFPLNESSRFRVLSPDDGLERTMNIMAGRKRHSAEGIVCKLRRADEVAAQGKTGEEIAADQRAVAPPRLGLGALCNSPRTA
jgi:hypothetical protein